MNRLALYFVLALGLFGLGFVTALGVSSHRASAKAQAAQTQADQHEGAAQTHAAQAAASDQQATKDKAAITDTDAQTASAKRELDRRLAALHGDAPASHPAVKDSLTPELPAIPAGPDELALTRAALAQAQAVIAAQGDQLAARDRLIASLTASRDEWKASAEEAQKALALQQVAANATVRSEHAQGIKSQIIRGLEGFAIGYVSGRLQR